jgi:hypothetical protein
MNNIEDQYRTATDLLFAAILREPHNFRRFAGKMSPAWFAASRFDRAAWLLWELYASAGRYSVNGFLHQAEAKRIQVNPDEVRALITDKAGIDLETAYSMCEPIYKVWVEHRCAQMIPGLIAKGIDAAGIRKAQEDYRRASGAYTIQDEFSFDAFDQWIADKLDGYEPDYPCKPHLPGMRRVLKFFEPGTVALIAGRPGMGKTQYALNLLEYFDDCGLHGVFNSLEMGYDALLRRRIGIRTGIDPNASWAVMTQANRDKLSVEANKIRGSKVRYCTEYGISAFVSMLHSQHYERPIQYAIVDYLQLMRVEGANKNANKEAIVSEISRSLMEVAKTLKICVFALCQFNRALETRGGSKRPTLSDLRDSGSLEQDAHYVFAMYRPEYYEITEDEKGNSTIGAGEIITLKNRNGPIVPFPCRFDPITGFFEDQPESIPQFQPQVQFSRNEENIPF